MTSIASSIPGYTPHTARAPRTYRGAVIGLGGIARQAHLPGFLGDPAVRERLRIVATVDGGAGVTPVDDLPHFADRAALLRAGPIDFVDICTPTASHLELTLWALEHGYHVLCEKPVAVSRGEAARIADAARAAGRIVMPCHQYRYNPVWRRVRAWLDEGAIGRWHLAELHVYRLMADRGTSAAPTPWRGRAEHSRGGVLLDHGTHLIYQMLDAAGVPEAVRAWTGQLRHADYDVEDSAQLLFEYPGRLGAMFVTWGARHRENRVRFIGECGTIEWIGGTLRLERDGSETSFDYSAELDKRSYASWFSGLFAAFADAMDGGAQEPHLQDIADVAAVLDGAYESAATGCRVVVEREGSGR
jgi:predicted dehydrogenase